MREITHKLRKVNSVAWVRNRTIPAERSPLVSEISIIIHAIFSHRNTRHKLRLRQYFLHRKFKICIIQICEKKWDNSIVQQGNMFKIRPLLTESGQLHAPLALPLVKRASSTHWNGCAPEMVRTTWRRENSSPCRDSNSDLSQVQPVPVAIQPALQTY
jgi:hypothetical protein